MTTRPRLERNSRQAVGLLAFVLFAVLAAVFLTADLGSAQGFPGEGSITASIGYAMFNLEGGEYAAEGFLVAFIIIAVVLDAALDAAVMLARRDEGESHSGPESHRRSEAHHEPGARGSTRTDGGRDEDGDVDGVRGGDR